MIRSGPVPRRFALLPMALAAPALAAALLFPAGLDPLGPLASAPSEVWLLLLLAGAAPAATVFTAREAIADGAERNRQLIASGVAALAGLAITAVVSLELSGALLVRGGGAFALLVLAMAGVAVAAGALAAFPGEPLCRGILLGETVIALITGSVAGRPRTPDEWVRRAMVLAPGWGATSEAALLQEEIARRVRGGDYDATLRAIEADLADLAARGAFQGRDAAWADDAAIERSWIFANLAGNPELSDEDRTRLWSQAAALRLAFAINDHSELEPFTAAGVLAQQALAETEDIDAAPALRLRIHSAWMALRIHVDDLDEPAQAKLAEDTLRGLFENDGLDRTSPLYLATVAVDKRRLVEAADAVGFLAYFDGQAKGDWPDSLKAAFARESQFVRDHPEDGYAPVMRLLQARSLADRDPVKAAAAYDALLREFPDGTVAPLARADRERRK